MPALISQITSPIARLIVSLIASLPACNRTIVANGVLYQTAAKFKARVRCAWIATAEVLYGSVEISLLVKRANGQNLAFARR